MSLSDDVLIKTIAQGDRVALRTLFDRYYGPLTVFLKSYTDSPHDTADIAQDCFLAIWKKAATYSGRSSVKTWIYTIARNAAIDRLRKNNRLDITNDVPEQVDESPSALDTIAAAQNAQKVHYCIKQLKAHHARVVQLVFFDELEYEDVASIEDCAVGTIKSRIYHAKALLQRCIAELP